MQMSKKRKTQLYNAISDPIMRVRIIVQGQERYYGVLQRKTVDGLLCKLEREIWHEVKKALDLNDG